MSTTDTTASKPVAKVPPSDDEMVEIKVADGKTLSVRFALLMCSTERHRSLSLPSSVFRDAIHMQALSESNTGGIKAKKLDLEMKCSLVAAKLLFALLAGQDYKSLASTSPNNDQELRDLLTTQNRDIPLVPVFRDVLAQADFLDIPFVPQLLVSMLSPIGHLGMHQSISAFAIAVQLGHVALAKFAVERMVGLPNPLAFEDSTVRNLQMDAWRILIQAYHKAIVPAQSLYKREFNGISRAYEYVTTQASPAWIGDAKQWKLLSEAIVFK
ncbi:hypothetical protein FFLO_04587 [Filobasidium floriforme]|uniref:BTB domain-containing protein n=1 Tax=Filobasidium floriforme TaxID=5210 RepID=A0A8K0NS54_9TREE|nr:hypothetical protein FFLO_04587 [Filobasidium floriforme]